MKSKLLIMGVLTLNVVSLLFAAHESDSKRQCALTSEQQLLLPMVLCLQEEHQKAYDWFTSLGAQRKERGSLIKKSFLESLVHVLDADAHYASIKHKMTDGGRKYIESKKQNDVDAYKKMLFASACCSEGKKLNFLDSVKQTQEKWRIGEVLNDDEVAAILDELNQLVAKFTPETQAIICDN